MAATGLIVATINVKGIEIACVAAVGRLHYLLLSRLLSIDYK